MVAFITGVARSINPNLSIFTGHVFNDTKKFLPRSLLLGLAGSQCLPFAPFTRLDRFLEGQQNQYLRGLRRLLLSDRIDG